jgi:DNA-binding NtrC family response regulator
VLENGEYQRVGETQRRTARCRVIAATNRDLRRALRQGAFRADLYHRLSVFTLSVPPLRELEQDKLLLLQHFQKLYSSQGGLPPFELDQGATARWLRYDFPGNVRELRNIVIRLSAKYPGQRLSAAELEPELDLQETTSLDTGKNPVVEQALRQLERAAQFDLDETLRAWERGYIEAALRLTRGNVTQAAKLLGINRTTLYSRMAGQGAENPLGKGEEK